MPVNVAPGGWDENFLRAWLQRMGLDANLDQPRIDSVGATRPTNEQLLAAAAGIPNPAPAPSWPLPPVRPGNLGGYGAAGYDMPPWTPPLPPERPRGPLAAPAAATPQTAASGAGNPSATPSVNPGNLWQQMPIGGQGGNRAPIITMGGPFGGGPLAAPGAPPASASPTTTNAPWWMGPYQQSLFRYPGPIGPQLPRFGGPV